MLLGRSHMGNEQEITACPQYSAVSHLSAHSILETAATGENRQQYLLRGCRDTFEYVLDRGYLIPGIKQDNSATTPSIHRFAVYHGIVCLY